MKFRSNYLPELRCYEVNLQNCINTLEAAIKGGTHRFYYEGRIVFAVSSDKERSGLINLSKEDLEVIRYTRKEELKELRDKIKYLEGLAETAANDLENDK